VPLLTTSLIIAETHRLTVFRAGAQAARRFPDVLDASPAVTVHFPTRDDHAAARGWLERQGSRPVTHTDAVSFAVMTATGCRHVTSLRPASRSGADLERAAAAALDGVSDGTVGGPSSSLRHVCFEAARRVVGRPARRGRLDMMYWLRAMSPRRTPGGRRWRG
jgi:hypothetical protein